MITAGRRTALEARVAARQAEAEARAMRAERVAATVSGDGKALDPKDPEHRQAVEEAFAAILSESADLEPEAFAAQAAQFAGATGMVPERLVTRVSAGLRSEDANTQADAARLLKAIDGDASDAPFNPLEVARADVLNRYSDAGIAAPEAVRLADEDMEARDGAAPADGGSVQMAKISARLRPRGSDVSAALDKAAQIFGAMARKLGPPTPGGIGLEDIDDQMNQPPEQLPEPPRRPPHRPPEQLPEPPHRRPKQPPDQLEKPPEPPHRRPKQPPDQLEKPPRRPPRRPPKPPRRPPRRPPK